MRYLSVCSGIEAATVAWHPIGWQPVAFAEIDKFPSAVLAHHYPTVPNWGDLTRFRDWPDATIDLLVGGTPCQSFSVAGLRKGLADPRGNLALVYLAVLDRYRPRWFCWENVPGVLSADDGGAMGAFLGGLGELGYGFAYRVLDAQYFGLAQRRARVFVVGHLGDWRRAAAVLLERESLLGHPAPRRETGEAAPTIPSRRTAGGGLRADGFDASEDGTGRGTPLVTTLAIRGRGDSSDLECRTDGTANAILTPNGGRGGIGVGAVAFAENQRGELVTNDTMGALKVGGGKPGQWYPAVAFDARQSDVLQYGDISGPLDTDGHTIGIAWEDYAGAYEADASSVLRTLRQTVGTQAVAEWGSRILDSLQSPEVLRAWLHGASLRRTSSDFRSFVDDRPLSRAEGSAAATLRKVWENGPDGRSPQGRGLAKQLAQQLRTTLPELPSARASEPVMRVRRLTPRECERLMGFPDDYTLIPYRGKPAADGPRYKALGNSMAVPVMAWIGQRIALVERVLREVA